MSWLPKEAGFEILLLVKLGIAWISLCWGLFPLLLPPQQSSWLLSEYPLCLGTAIGQGTEWLALLPQSLHCVAGSRQDVHCGGFRKKQVRVM